MPAVVEPTAKDAPSARLHPAGGIASAIVNVGQGLMLGKGETGIITSAGAIVPRTLGLPDLSGLGLQEQLDLLNSRLQVEQRIRIGAENLLQVFDIDPPDDRETVVKKIESELQVSKTKLANIGAKINELRESLPGTSNGLRRYAAADADERANVRSAQTRFRHAQSTVGKPHKGNSRARNSVDRDDIKTALAQASQLIQKISELSHTPVLNSPPDAVNLTGANSKRMSEAARRDCELINSMNELVAMFERNIRVRYAVNSNEIAMAILPALGDDVAKETRAATYRVIRYVVVDLMTAEVFQGRGLCSYLVRSLSRDAKHGIEKEHALNLISSLIDIAHETVPPEPDSPMLHPVDDSLVRALIAIAEHPEDPFGVPCLIMLVDLMLVDIECVWRNGAMRLLLQTLTDGPADLAPEIAMAILQVVDSPVTRRYLAPGVDLEMAFSSFTDAYGKGSGNADRMRASSKVITVMLRTWSGLMYLCMDDMRTIRSLIDTLRISSLDTREVILDTFFDVLKIKTPDWFNTFLEGRRLTMYRHKDNDVTSTKAPEVDTVKNGRLKITDQFLSLLLVIVTECGLLNALGGILEEDGCDPNIWRKSALLLGEILHMSNRLLPLSRAAKLQSLPRLFELAAAFGTHTGREVAATAFSSIESFNRNRIRLQTPTNHLKRSRANSVEDSVRRNQRQVDQARIQYGMQVDDKTFQTLLIETQVMTHRDHTKWDFDVLMNLVEGPLLNPKRFEEAMKGSKFGRRLMQFLHPRQRRFSEIKKNKPNMKWIRLAIALITTLITSPEGHGVRFLATDDPLLPEMTSCLNELMPFQGAVSADPIFSVLRIETTLSSGYFEIIGVLSKYPDGIKLMERHKMFTAFYHISEFRSRDDLIHGVIENLDYTIDGHPRIILSKALTSSYKHIRQYATVHLGQLIRSAPKANEWTLRLLLTQLYDPDSEVANLAMSYLEDFCRDPDMLELVVQMQPTFDHLGEKGQPLLLRFMTSSVGFQYLYDSDYINLEIESWFHYRNLQYAVQIEVHLAQMLGHSDDDPKRDDIPWFDGMVPPHFYGEMAKSNLGSQVLAEKGHFGEFVHFIRQHGLEDIDLEIIHKLKSVLWVVGHIGAAPDGFLFLEEEGLIPVIIEIAENSEVLSVRGTCFYVLGLISSTTQAAEILMEYGWEATLTPLQTATGLCLPQDFVKFVSLQAWRYPPSTWGEKTIKVREARESAGRSRNTSNRRRVRDQENLPDYEREILDSISNLSNTVIANEAARNLARLKARHPSSFQSISLFAHVQRALASEHYRLPVRRYILDQLFSHAVSPGTAQDKIVNGEGVGGGGIKMTPDNMHAVEMEIRRLGIVEREQDTRRLQDYTKTDQPSKQMNSRDSVWTRHLSVRKPRGPSSVVRIEGFNA